MEVGFKEVGFKVAAVQLVSHVKNGTVCTVLYIQYYKKVSTHIMFIIVTLHFLEKFDPSF